MKIEIIQIVDLQPIKTWSLEHYEELHISLDPKEKIKLIIRTTE